jgi:nucleotide-binding universal stress UspA family protein
MYERILVALDGSELAERIPPHVETLGRALGSTLIVLRAARSPETIIAELNAGAMVPAVGMIDPQPLIDAEREEADSYLATIAERLREHGLRVQTERPDGPAADAILRRAVEVNADLITMTTNGRTGLGRMVFGSVAGDVVRRSPRPLLVIGMTDHAPTEEARA